MPVWKPIRRAPERHSIIHESYRRALVRRFPFAAFYEYVGGRVIVYGVFHTARDPGKMASAPSLTRGAPMSFSARATPSASFTKVDECPMIAASKKPTRDIASEEARCCS
jgi:hypothetical protein